ncbi:hypothetical protein DTW90_19765 [Neorhizobium sp. P12A]|nr:hypothetical protein DTW90_19765 [Neorhizobium sp. P12A]
MPIERLERCCGPEDGMAYHVPADIWQRRVDQLAEALENLESLPPLIVEWCEGRLMIRDGNHRCAAIIRKGWTSCFIVLWCNSSVDQRQAAASLNIDITRR